VEGGGGGDDSAFTCVRKGLTSLCCGSFRCLVSLNVPHLLQIQISHCYIQPQVHTSKHITPLFQNLDYTQCRITGWYMNDEANKIEVLGPHLGGGTEKQKIRNPLRRGEVPVELRIQHSPNISVKQYTYASLFGHNFCWKVN
jgi:hypothetical protein